MIEAWKFDILGHCDLMKKRNTGNRFFDPQAPWYRKMTTRLLKSVKKHNLRIELNTGGIARGATNEPYPSPDMLATCAEFGIPITLSSDAHQSSHLDFYFSRRRPGSRQAPQHRCLHLHVERRFDH